MTVVGKSLELIPPLIRYVEAKCLVSGVTTSLGIALFTNAGIRRFYRGIVRNVEETDEENLPEAETRIADVGPQSAQKWGDQAFAGEGDAQGRTLKAASASEEARAPKPVAMIGRRRPPTTWQLALEEIEDTGFDLRPMLRSRHSRQLTGPTRRAAVAAKPLSQILQPLKLDLLAVVDDPDFLRRSRPNGTCPMTIGEILIWEATNGLLLIKTHCQELVTR